MKQLIQNWLNGKRNFTAGKLLYNQFGNDVGLKQLFGEGKSDFTEKKLLVCLQELISGTAKNERKEYKAAIDDVMPESENKIMAAIRNEWMPFYTEMNLKRHRIDQYLEDESEEAEVIRGKLAFEILDLEQKCMAVWAKRFYYEKNGRLPGKNIDTEIVVDEFKAAERIKNLKIYITRYKNYCKKDPGNATYPSRLAEYESEYIKLLKIHGKER